MKLTNKILKKLGLKALSWDREFKTDYWDKSTLDDPIYEVLKEHPGSCLEMGCGSGMTPVEMKFVEFTGVDLSAIAIAKARGRVPEHEFIVSAMEDFVPRRRYDTILFRESIYYCKDVVGLLARLQPYLQPGGVFIIRICDRVRHRGVIDDINHCWRVGETIMLPTGGIILIFK